MSKRLNRRLFLIIVLLFLLAACGGSSGGGDPVKTVEDYLQAKIKGDKDALRVLLCADMESKLNAEAASYSTVTGVEIQDMVCKLDGDVVRCEGKIVAEYGTEKTDFPLGAYKVVQEDGEWKWCGETS